MEGKRMLLLQLKPFLRYPVNPLAAEISEGFIYRVDESVIHHRQRHNAIDFMVKPGMSVHAAAAGSAIASYSFDFARDREGGVITWKNKAVGYSLGYHVRIMHGVDEKTGAWLCTTYGHLQQQPASEIHYFEPTKRKRGTFAGLPFPQLPISYIAEGTWVEQGQFLGYVGITGMEWGVKGNPGLKYFDGNYWCQPHLHFALGLIKADGNFAQWVDPFGIGGQAEKYQEWKSNLAKPQGLWLPWWK